ncbi:DoxX family protein [Pseudomonas gingeri]|uniref:DoxX family protein n=1 Tax=Pseudomonas gingeri TaxID=117681 RepID=UPI0015A000DF|nr:DoxX family protein [Pseudomonas gingeri]NWA24103.1 DoxX family protein [Pseudomonas gingeri]NWD69488.1 DoxX family protein [Pseudomonas gingeri]NWD75874.1 DoxX family protein [Pseudomonas gingeri]
MVASPLLSSRISADWALLWLRLAGSALLLRVHGLPKLLDFQHQLTLIEDPFGLGAHLTLSLAIFAEVLCPLLIILGLLTRLATLPLLFLLLVSLVWVHPEWSLAEGQFAWLLVIVFFALLIGGSGSIALDRRFPLFARLGSQRP